MDPPWIDGPAHWGDPEYEAAMKDKELADKLVEMGIAEHDASLPGALTYSVRNRHGHWDHFSADLLVTDWRVAGAVMEKMTGELLIWRINYEDEDLEGGELISLQTGHAWVVEPPRSKDARQNESLPRAIIEAGLEALSCDT